MLTVQVSCKNSTDGHWNSVAHYKTRRGVNNFITKNKALYPEDGFNIRIIGYEEVEPEAPNCRQVVKIGDVFVENTYDWDDKMTFYEAYAVVGFTRSGKSVRVKKLAKIDVGDTINGRNSVTWKVKFVKPSDEFMKNSENVKNVRLLECDGAVIFYVDPHKIEDSYIESDKIVKSHIIVNEIAELDKNFSYDNIYIEGLFE